MAVVFFGAGGDVAVLFFGAGVDVAVNIFPTEFIFLALAATWR